eukprot:scaffold7946_cov403-Prasinococcus_capsulatus_cf.AAC.2
MLPEGLHQSDQVGAATRNVAQEAVVALRNALRGAQSPDRLQLDVDKLVRTLGDVEKLADSSFAHCELLLGLGTVELLVEVIRLAGRAEAPKDDGVCGLLEAAWDLADVLSLSTTGLQELLASEFPRCLLEALGECAARSQAVFHAAAAAGLQTLRRLLVSYIKSTHHGAQNLRAPLASPSALLQCLERLAHCCRRPEEQHAPRKRRRVELDENQLQGPAKTRLLLIDVVALIALCTDKSLTIRLDDSCLIPWAERLSALLRTVWESSPKHLEQDRLDSNMRDVASRLVSALISEADARTFCEGWRPDGSCDSKGRADTLLDLFLAHAPSFPDIGSDDFVDDVELLLNQYDNTSDVEDGPAIFASSDVLKHGKDASIVRCHGDTRLGSDHVSIQRWCNDGHSIPEGSWHTAVSQGYTVAIRNVCSRSPAIARVTDELSRLLRLPVSCNLYYTPFGGHQGLVPHVDDHCVLVVQLLGEKVWQVSQAARIHLPRLYSNCRVNGDTLPSRMQESCLRPSDLLYIPRGFEHYALTQQERLIPNRDSEAAPKARHASVSESSSIEYRDALNDDTPCGTV